MTKSLKITRMEVIIICVLVVTRSGTHDCHVTLLLSIEGLVAVLLMVGCERIEIGRVAGTLPP